MSSAADLSTETWCRIQYIPSDKINVENSAIQSLTSRLFSDQTSVICSFRKTIDGNRDTWALKLASLSTTWQTQGLSIYHPVEHYLEKKKQVLSDIPNSHIGVHLRVYTRYMRPDEFAIGVGVASLYSAQIILGWIKYYLLNVLWFDVLKFCVYSMIRSHVQ